MNARMRLGDEYDEAPDQRWSGASSVDAAWSADHSVTAFFSREPAEMRTP